MVRTLGPFVHYGIRSGRVRDPRRIRGRVLAGPLAVASDIYRSTGLGGRIRLFARGGFLETHRNGVG